LDAYDFYAALSSNSGSSSVTDAISRNYKTITADPTSTSADSVVSDTIARDNRSESSDSGGSKSTGSDISPAQNALAAIGDAAKKLGSDIYNAGVQITAGGNAWTSGGLSDEAYRSSMGLVTIGGNMKEISKVPLYGGVALTLLDKAITTYALGKAVAIGDSRDFSKKATGMLMGYMGGGIGASLGVYTKVPYAPIVMGAFGSYAGEKIGESGAGVIYDYFH
jgi:hypothetical protein